jgi:hypothetical protein
MSIIYNYAPVAEALEQLKKKGYTLDFNLEENCLVCGNTKLQAEDFSIREVYRYEGNSDPADEAAVYGIESLDGVKGVLVTGYGTSTDALSKLILSKLSS